MVDFCVFGINSVRSICKQFKSVIRKWLLPHLQCHNQTPQEPVEDNKGDTTMNGVHSFRFNDDALRGNDPTSSGSRGGLYRHRSLDNCFSRENHTRSESRSRSMKSYAYDDSTATTSSLNSSGSLRMPPPHLHSKNGSSRWNSTQIMFSNSSGMLKPPPIEKKIECTLEELCYGCNKKIKITREVLTDTGAIVQEEELLTINVQPGWKKGTKVTFEGKGNERPGAYREDIIFFISEKRHQLFRREGDDLELCVEIPLLKALSGCTISVPLLGGEHRSLKIDDIIWPGYDKIITGQGMPISTEPRKRGNLRIKFLVEFPKQLTDKQRSEVVGILQNSC